MCVLQVRPELLGCGLGTYLKNLSSIIMQVSFLSVGNNRNNSLLLYMNSCEGEGKKKILRVHLIAFLFLPPSKCSCLCTEVAKKKSLRCSL